jgi:hypothetical protein
MKSILTLFFLLLIFVQNAKSQTVLTMQEARSKSLIKELDKTHETALNNDKNLAAFPGDKKTEFLTAYKLLFYDLANHLDKNGFKFGKETQCYNRIYFNSNGTINYYFYSIKPGEIDPANESKFKKLLGDFIKTYQMKVSAPTNFFQSGPVKFTDKK